MVSEDHARKLPWRGVNDPYRTWVSEIMLQQTRVAAVIEHYNEFLRRFPTMLALALAPEAEVLAAWSGLGYYRRARMLHKAAQFITRERAGCLPTDCGGAADAAGDWRVHGCGDCEHCVWRECRRGGWECGAGDAAADGAAACGDARRGGRSCRRRRARWFRGGRWRRV